MTQSDDQLPSLDALQRKIDEVKPESDEEPPANSGSSLGQAMHMATELAAGVGVGGVIGYFADKAFGTSPFLFIGCFFLGFAAGVRNMLRSIAKTK